MSVEAHIQSVAKFESPFSPEGRSARFGRLMFGLLNSVLGNVVEIGAGVGQSTMQFLIAAAWHNRQVIVIDPWEGDVPPGYGGYSYSEFLENVKRWENHLKICKHPSNSDHVHAYLKDWSPIAFAFVDGIQTFNEVLADIRLCERYKAQVICVDDINRNSMHSQVPNAVAEFLRSGTYKLVETEPLIECYLIRSS